MDTIVCLIKLLEEYNSTKNFNDNRIFEENGEILIKD